MKHFHPVFQWGKKEHMKVKWCGQDGRRWVYPQQDRIQYVGSISNNVLFEKHAMEKISVTLGIAPGVTYFHLTVY